MPSSLFRSTHPSFQLGFLHSGGTDLPLDLNTIGVKYSFYENIVGGEKAGEENCITVDSCDHASFLAVKRWLHQNNSVTVPFFNLELTVVDEVTSKFINDGIVHVYVDNAEITPILGETVTNSFGHACIQIPFQPYTHYKVAIEKDGYLYDATDFAYGGMAFVTGGTIQNGSPYYGHISFQLYSEEKCGDGIDNDFDGEVDEECGLFHVVQVTDNSYSDIAPDLNDNGKVVWVAAGKDNENTICTYDPAAVPSVSTYVDKNHASNPEINDSDQILWHQVIDGNIGTSTKVRLYLSSNSGSELLVSSASYARIENSSLTNSGLVTWDHPYNGAYGGQRAIYYYDSNNNINYVDFEVDENQSKPDINEHGQIVWISSLNGETTVKLLGHGEIVTLSLPQHSINAYPQINDLGHVVWMCGDGDGYDLCFYNGNSVIQITDDDGDDYEPLINNHDEIVWVKNDGHDSEVFFFENGVTTQLTDNDYDDNRLQINNVGHVVWSGYDGHDQEIFFYNGEFVSQITDNDTLDYSPVINDKSQVVWIGDEFTSSNGSHYGDMELFFATPGRLIDIDEDSVIDDFDRCPDTPANEQSNRHGCSLSQLTVRLVTPIGGRIVSPDVAEFNQYNFTWQEIDHPNNSSFEYCVSIKKDLDIDESVYEGCDLGELAHATQLAYSLAPDTGYVWVVWARDTNSEIWSQPSYGYFSTPPHELCLDGVDNDLDGEIDEDCRYAYLDEEKSVILDDTTGLLWENFDGRCGYYLMCDVTLSQARSYCSSLVLGGYSDWRLPSSSELANLVYCSNGKLTPTYSSSGCFDSSRGNYSRPTIDSAFTGWRGNNTCWTSNSYVVSFQSGGYQQLPTNYERDVRCVR